MKIGIDISSIVYNTGVSRYTANLARALVKTTANKVLLYGASLRRLNQLQTFAGTLPQATSRLYPIPPKATDLIFHHLKVPITTLTGSLDVFHAWDWYLPQSNTVATVTTVHDLALFKFPSIAHAEIRRRHQITIERAKAARLHIITVSQATKQDLIDIFGYESRCLHVVPEALPTESAISVSENIVKKVQEKYSITKPYLLSVGTLEPRKNYPRQIQAWKARRHDLDYVIVGKPGWEEIKPQPGLHLISAATPEELAALYGGAEALLYASLYEGFGLPILEAFHHHLPVITAATGSMPEVAGKAAVLVDPQSVDAIATGIDTARNQKTTLVAKGIHQLNHFSWDQTAAATLAVYKEAIHDR